MKKSSLTKRTEKRNRLCSLAESKSVDSSFNINQEEMNFEDTAVLEDVVINETYTKDVGIQHDFLEEDEYTMGIFMCNLFIKSTASSTSCDAETQACIPPPQKNMKNKSHLKIYVKSVKS